MIGLVFLCKQVVESLSLYETSILDVDLCVECARGFHYLDDLKTFFDVIWNVCSLTTLSLVSIKVVWNLTFRRPLLYRIQPPLRLRQSRQPNSKFRPKRWRTQLRLRQSPPSDRPQQWKRRETYCFDYDPITGSYTGWGRLKEKIKVTDRDHQSFCLQNQYADLETGLHYNFFRYYEPDAGRFVNQDLIGLEEGFNVYQFAPNAQDWVDPLGLSKCSSRSKTPNPYQGVKEASQSNQNGTSWLILLNLK